MRYLNLILSLTSIFLLQGCGGGGGGGTFSSYRNTISGDYLTEYNYQSMLSSVNPLSLNDYGYDGTGIKVAVVDTGIDASHPEFDGKTIYGYDFAGSASGYDDDEHGHGTHVASIIAGDRDETGMRGVAYDSTLYSYKIDNDGDSGTEGIETDAKLAALYNKHTTDNIKVSNNSWGVSAEITDWTASAWLSATSDSRQALKSAQDSGTLFVFSAGNSSFTKKTNPNAVGGTPYYDSDLADAWLVVVSVDSNLKETAYTYRCGVAKSFCVTAPGGGDTQSSDGILAAKANTSDYVRYSGTSMAAPHVSGLAAALMEKFPNLTPAQISTRIKNGASLSSLTGYNGQTLVDDGEASMQSIFGYGLVNAENSAASMGNLTYLRDGSIKNGVDISEQKIDLSSSISNSVISKILDDDYVVFDSFDGANFNVKGRDIFSYKDDSLANAYAVTDVGAVINSNQLFKLDDYQYSPLLLGEVISGRNSNDVFWKGKSNLFDSKPLSLKSNVKEISYINQFDHYIISPYIRTLDDSSIGNYGLLVAGEINPTSSYAFSVSNGKDILNSGYLDQHNTLQNVTEVELGLQSNLTDNGQLFFKYSKVKIDDLNATTNSFGLSNALAENINIGYESILGDSTFTFGVDKDYSLSGGELIILSPTELKSNGDVIYSQKVYEIQNNNVFNPYFAYATKIDDASLTLGTKLNRVNHSESISLNYSLPF